MMRFGISVLILEITNLLELGESSTTTEAEVRISQIDRANWRANGCEAGFPTSPVLAWWGAGVVAKTTKKPLRRFCALPYPEPKQQHKNARRREQQSGREQEPAIHDCDDRCRQP